MSQRRLREYRRKRHFRVTPEPAPARRPAQRSAHAFMVHKHDANRLHYDLRLEMNGVLASWAIPKGPSYDPSQKRLAVETEDHPREYAAFEGRIPDGEYGAGDSLVWDRGSYDTVPPGQAAGQKDQGHLHLELRGVKLKGRWHLVRTRRPGQRAQWLLFKAKDERADPSYDVVAARPESVVSGRRLTRGPERARVLRAAHLPPETLLERVFPPMLATLVDEPPADGDRYFCENKYDGFRALCAISSGRVAMWSRNRLDLGGRFPEIRQALSRMVVGEVVIDGEAVALDNRGISRFEALQQGRAARFYAFDLLWLDGRDVRGRPIEERRELLESVMANLAPPLLIAERLDGPPDRALARVARSGGEGIVLKRHGSRYEGRRTRNWLKLKVENTQELAIVGYTPAKNSDRLVGALLLAVVEEGRFRFAGKVGTGFTTELRRNLMQLHQKDVVDRPIVEDPPRMRDAVWVKPRHVAQVRFTEWTRDGKLRHPSFQGLRPDKKPEDCVREQPAAAPEIILTHPEKILFLDDGFTKKQVAEYYAELAGPLTRALRDRPVAFEQWPNGVDRKSIFRQNVKPEPWMHVIDTPTSTARRHACHLAPDSPEALRWLAQNAALTIHMWSSREGHLDEPDWVVFDLDPAGDFADTIQIARALRDLLDELSLPSLPKTSGKRGLHVMVPLAPGHSHEAARDFAVRVGESLTSVMPQATMARPKRERRGRLYFDCFQNGYGKTLVAPYSLRGVDGAPVSAPLDWSEVTAKLDPASFNLRTMRRRLDERGDLFSAMLARGARLPKLR